jgi:hypothetical protein
MSNDEWWPRRGYQRTEFGYILDGIEFITPDKREAYNRSRKTPDQLAKESDWEDHNDEQWRKLKAVEKEIGDSIKKRNAARARADHEKDKLRLKELSKTLRGVRGQ